MPTRPIAASLLCLALAVAAPAVVHAQSQMPSISNPMAQHRVELTENMARNALDAHRDLEERFGDGMPAQSKSDTVAAARAWATHHAAMATFSHYGFQTPQEWVNAMVSLSLAYGFASGKIERAEVDESLQQMQDNPQIPEELREQMMAMVAGMKPSDNNLSVARALMEEPDYRERLSEVFD